MRYLFVIIGILLSSSVYAGMPHQDKVAHTIVSFAISTTTYTLCKNHMEELDKNECMASAIGVAIISGMVKEFVIDRRFDGYDMLSNTIGVGLSIPFIHYEF